MRAASEPRGLGRRALLARRGRRGSLGLVGSGSASAALGRLAPPEISATCGLVLARSSLGSRRRRRPSGPRRTRSSRRARPSPAGLGAVGQRPRSSGRRRTRRPRGLALVSSVVLGSRVEVGEVLAHVAELRDRPRRPPPRRRARARCRPRLVGAAEVEAQRHLLVGREIRQGERLLEVGHGVGRAAEVERAEARSCGGTGACGSGPRARRGTRRSRRRRGPSPCRRCRGRSAPRSPARRAASRRPP